MTNKEIVQEWLAAADDDFHFALINFKEGKTFFAQICFHPQQSAEKYLKSYIVAHELEFRKIHELPLLIRMISLQEVAKVDGTAKSSPARRDKARESLPAADRLRNEAYIEVRRNDAR